MRSRLVEEIKIFGDIQDRKQCGNENSEVIELTRLRHVSVDSLRAGLAESWTCWELVGRPILL